MIGILAVSCNYQPATKECIYNTTVMYINITSTKAQETIHAMHIAIVVKLSCGTHVKICMYSFVKLKQ